MNNQTVTVNLVPNKSTPAVVHVSQGDVGRPLEFRILDGTTEASFTAGTTVTITGTKPSGLGFTETATLTARVVTIDTTLAMTQESGMIPAEIRFTQGTTDIGTANFILAVEKTPHADGTTDGTQETMQNLETRLQGEIDGLDDRVTTLENNGGGVQIDATLTQTGQAADAKVTGDVKSEVEGIRTGADGTTYQTAGDAVRGQVSDLKEDLESEQDDGLFHRYLTWEHGGIDNATGQNNNEGSLTRSRMPEYLLYSDYNQIFNGASARTYVIYYDSESF